MTVCSLLAKAWLAVAGGKPSLAFVAYQHPQQYAAYFYPTLSYLAILAQSCALAWGFALNQATWSIFTAKSLELSAQVEAVRAFANLEPSAWLIFAPLGILCLLLFFLCLPKLGLTHNSEVGK